MNTRDLPPLESLLPHRGPMLLLDRVIDAENATVVCETVVREDSSFCEPGTGVPAWVAIEYLAQTAAVLGGIQAWREQRKAPQGMLLGSRQLQSEWAAFPVGSVLRTHCEQAFADPGGMTAYQGGIEVDGRQIVSATFNIFLDLNAAESS